MITNKNVSSNFTVAAVLILISAATRLIPHPFNFTAIGAMALFSGAHFRDKRFAFLVPFIAMFLTDLILGLHFSILPVYACLLFTVWMGIKISGNQNVISIISCSLISSIVFFLITNLPVWYVDLKLYPMTTDGTLESYTMALPFFKNQILGDLFYNGVFFGLYYLISRKNPQLTAEKIKK